MVTDTSAFEAKSKLSGTNTLLTIIGSVLSAISKKNISFRIGVATVLLVTAFTAVVLSVFDIQTKGFIYHGQQAGSDIDIVMTMQKSLQKQSSLHVNPYGVDPFFETSDSIISPQGSGRNGGVTESKDEETAQQSLTTEVLGVNLFNR